MASTPPTARRSAAAPGFVEPMLAMLTENRFSDPNWIYERKPDGVRVVVVREARRTRLYSRNGKPLNGTYPELVEALDEQALDGLVADGEVVAFEGVQTSFPRLQARLGITDPDRARATGMAVTLYLFDVMATGGHDLTALPLRTRKRVLRAAVEFTDPLRFSAHRNADGEAYLQQACERGWEGGLIAKRGDARYRPGRRSEDWLKFKCVREQEFVIAGYTDPAGSRVGFGALLVGYYDRDGPNGGGLRYAGKVGTGFDQRLLRSLRARFDDLTNHVPVALLGPGARAGDALVAIRDRGADRVHGVDPRRQAAPPPLPGGARGQAGR